MDAPPASRAAVWPTGGTIAAQLTVLAADALLVLVALATGFVWVRRATGALVEPLPAAALIGSGAALSLAAVLFRGWHASGGSSRRLPRYAVWAAPSAVLALAAGGLSLAESSPAGLVGLWGLIALEEGWCWERFLRGARTRTMPTVERGGPRVGVALGEASVATTIESTEPDQEGVSQYLVRHRGDNGGESMDGWIRAELVPAQRHAIAHVAICPPFERTPRCYAEIADGPPGDVKIGQVLPYGVRFEIKLDKPAAEATSVTVEFSIQEHGALDDDRGEGDET